jgi:hypothetical protein
MDWLSLCAERAIGMMRFAAEVTVRVVGFDRTMRPSMTPIICILNEE